MPNNRMNDVLIKNCKTSCGNRSSEDTGVDTVEHEKGSSPRDSGGKHIFSILTERRSGILLFGLFSVLLATALTSCDLGPSAGGGQASYVTDFSDDRKLVGFADDVFFGQVVENLGTSERQGLPESQFRVQVLETLKGSLGGEVTINQSGEFHMDGSQEEFMGEPALLERGNSYLLVTRTWQETGWHTVASPYGRILIRGVSKDAPGEEVLNNTHAKELRSRFTQAVLNEIPFALPQDPTDDPPPS